MVDEEFTVANFADFATNRFLLSAFVKLHMLVAGRRKLEIALLLKTLPAVRESTEIAVTVLQIACFFPLFAASVATVRSVVMLLRVYWALHVENVFILNESEFAVSDLEFAAFFD